jgi:hypothetical protein
MSTRLRTLLASLPRFRSPALPGAGRKKQGRYSPPEVLENRIAPAAIIGATTTKTFFVDADLDGKADPGLDTIQYVVTISNSGDADATNVSYNDTLDPNTTLFGTVLKSPLAGAKLYPNAAGNTVLSVNAASGLKVGATDLDGVTPFASLAVTAGTFPTSQGGTVVVAGDGSFTYTPQTGDQGVLDTFVYTVSDGDGLKGTGTATINLGPRVWYVDSVAGGGASEDGSSTHPYNALSDITGASGADTVNDFIFIKNAGAAYDGNLTLLDNQHVYGSGATLTVNGVTINTAGTNTSLTTTTGATNTITLPSGPTGADLHGFTLGNSAAGATGIAITGANFVKLKVENITINTTGSALSLTSATTAAVEGLTGGSTAAFGNIAAGGGTNGILLSGITGTITDTGGTLTGTASGPTVSIVGGTVSLTHLGGITQGNNAAAVAVTSGHTGTLTFNTGTISATNGTGLQFDNADGTYNFNGTNTLNGGDAGIDILNGSSGTFSFGASTSITNPSGTAFNMLNSDGSVSYAGAISKNSAGLLISIDNHDGANTVGFGGTLSSTGTSTGILVQNNSAGTVNFGGTTKTLNTAANAAVTLLSNTGAVINFSNGGLDIDTTTATGFSATGGGTISISTGTNPNTIDTTTGVALNVVGTTIGAGGLTFRSITAGTASNSAGSGIILDTTGSSGGLTITGTGPAGSGGTIQHKTGANLTSAGVGIYLNSVGGGVSLTSMQLNDFSNYAIRGTNVTGFNLINSSVNGTNGDVAGEGSSDEGSIRFDNLLGKAAITNSTVTGGFYDNISIYNSSGVLDRLVVTGGTIGSTSTNGNDAIRFEHSGTAVANISVTGVTFTAARGDIFDAIAQPGATVDVVFTGNTVSNNNPNIVSGGGGFIVHGGGTVNFDVSNNTFRDARGRALNISKAATAGTFTGIISGNSIGVAGVDKSGSLESSCIFVDGGGAGSMDVVITGNTCNQYNEAGIYLLANNQAVGGNNATMSAVVTNNTTNAYTGGTSNFAFAGLFADLGSSAGDSSVMNLVLGGGAGQKNSFQNGDPFNFTDVSISRIGTASAFNLSQGVSGSSTPATVITDNNNATITTSVAGTITVASANTVRLLGNPVSAYEDAARNFNYTFTRTGNITAAQTVNFSVGGTATFGSDYSQSGAASFNTTTGSVTFAAGSPTATVTLDPTSDASIEPDETITLTATAGGGYTVATPSGRTVTILNDDVPLIFEPTIDVAPVIVTPTVVVPPPVVDGSTAPVIPPVIVDDGLLSQAELDSLVGAAIARWEATGLTPEQSALLHSVTFSVEDLSGWYLGSASPGHVVLDSNAAGNAWFIDATPNDDNEYTGAGTQLSAPIGAASGRVDALTTVMHELGHQLGLDDTYSTADTSNLMYGYMHLGERRLPGAHQADGADASHLAAGGSPEFAIGPVTIGTLNAGSSVQVLYRATVNYPYNAASGSNPSFSDQGTVSFDPSQTVLTNSVSTQVDLPDVNVTVTTGTASEASGTLVYTFTRADFTGANLTVNFTASGSATFTNDYTATSTGTLNFGAGTVVIPTGSSSVTVTLTPVDDRQVEGAETATLTLASGTGYDITGSAASGTLNDNDTATLSFTAGTSSGLESVVTQNVSTTLTITATGTGTIGLASNFTANLTTTGGTATGSGTDYTLPGSPAVTFTAADDFSSGSATKNAAIAINDDRQVEGDETAVFGLAIVTNIGTQGSIGGTTSHTLTITDNDTATLSFTTGTSTALESVGTQNINTTLTLNAIGTGTLGLAGNLTANLTTTGGTATGSGTDYTLPGSPAVTFLAGTYATGTGTQNATVTVVDDRQVEGSETAQLGLAIVTNIGTQVSIGGTTAHTLTLTDNDTATLSYTTGTSTALESAGTQNISTTLTISAIGSGTLGLASNLTANLTSTGGTATGSGTDYTLPGSPAVTFLAGTYATGTGTQLAAVTIVDDRQVEGDETAALGLSIVGNIGTQVSIGGTTAHTLTLTDNDTATLGFTLGSSTAQESAGTQSISTTLTINAIGTGNIGLASNLTANLTTQAGGTATGGGVDYTLPASPALTFLAGTYATGSGTQSASVTLINDGSPEGSETANLGLAIVTNIGAQVSIGGTTTHVLTIQDTSVSVALLSGTSVVESGAGLVYTFTRTGDNSTPLPINFTKAGTAVFNTDFTATSSASTFDYAAGTLTIPAGSFTATVTLVPTDDRTVEGNEDNTLTVASGTGYGLGGSPATGTITDNDTVTIGFGSATSSGSEGGNLAPAVTLTINAIGTGTISLASDIKADMTTTGGTATGGGTDYTLPASPAMTFLASADYSSGFAAKNPFISFTDDRLVEGDETALLGLTVVQNIGTQVSIGGITVKTLTISDNDTVTLGFTTATGTVLEGVGTQNVGTTITINAIGTGTIGLASNLTANLVTTGGTATGSGTDYTLPGSPAVTFLAGTYATGTATQNAVLTVVDDRQVEGDETALFALSIVQNIGTQVSIGGFTADFLTLTDNDTATLGFTVGTSTALESAGTQNVGLTLTLNTIGTGTIGLANNLTANLTTTGGTATGGGTDYTLPGSPAVTFLAGTYATGTGTQNAAITVVDDRQVEGSETAQFGLSIVSNIGTQVSLGGTTAHTLTLTDNDTATLGFTVGTSTALESAGTQNIGATLTINAIGTGTIGLASDLTANLTTTGGTATGSGTDYTLPGSPALTFLAGTYATGTATQNGAITVIDDRQVEGDETAGLGLSIVTNIGTQVSLGGTTAHTLTLTDNDTATLGFTVGTSTALESAGTQNISTTLTINAIGTGTIGLATNLTANLTTTGGTATGSGTDYTLPGSPAVTFLAGTYATGTATQLGAISVVDDRQVEGDETAQLGLSIVQNIGAQVSVGGTTAHTLTLTDNDTATLGFTVGTSTALESAGTQNIGTTLTLNTIGTGTIGLASNLTANLTTTGGTATGSGTDYTLPGSPAITFLAGTYATGTATQNAAVTVNDDRQVEGSETAQFGLSIVGNIGTQVSLGGTTAHTLTLTDNDTATLGFTLGTSTALESAGTQNIGTTLTINAIGTGTIGLASNLTANLTTTGGTATGSGTDYTLPGTPAITFLAGTYATGTGTQNAAVTVIDDRQVEGDETAGLGLSIVTNIGTQVSLGGTTAHTLTLTDNDTATLGFTVGTSTALESAGTQNISTTLTINAIGTGTIGLATNLTANLTTTGGTATGSGTDYTLPGSPAVTFLAGTYATGTATQLGAITVVDDRQVEGDETAQLGLSIVTNIGAQVSVGGTTAHTLTLTDNDTATLGFTVGTSTALESAGTQNVNTTLTLNTIGTGTIGLATNLTANLTTTGGTATGSGTDYTLPGSPALTFLAGTYATGTATQNAAVTVNDDRQVEGSETAQYGLSIVGNIGTQVSLGGTTAHTLTLTDNDTATLGFTTDTSTALESVGTQNIGTTLTITSIGTGTIGLASNLTANLTTTGGTATGSGTDYTLPGTPAVTFLAGAYATGTATQNGAVTVNDDRLVEGNETAALGLSIVGNIGTQVSLGGTTAHTLTLTDNDTATLGFTLDSSNPLESVGTHNVGTTLTINAIGTGTIGLASNLTTNLTVTGGSATGSGTDYTLPGSPSVTFLAGAYATGTATQNAAVTVIDDRLVEGDEDVSFGLSIVQNIGTQVSLGGTTAHTATISDNDFATIGFSTATSTVGEGTGPDVLGFTLTLNTTGTGTAALARDVSTAVIALAGGTAISSNFDYNLPSFVTFNTGAVSGATTTKNLSIVNDRFVEGSEFANLGMIMAADGTGGQASIATGAAGNHVMTITDNDTATIGYVAATSTIGEAGGTDALDLVLTINANGTGPITKLERDVTFNLTTVTAGSTATGGGTDYTLPTLVTFFAETLHGATQTVSLGITDDRAVEGSELANLGLAIVTDGTGTQISIAAGAAGTHATTITDNDSAFIRYVNATSSVAEGAGTRTLDFQLGFNTSGNTGTDVLERDVTFGVTTVAGGTATGGTDYTLPANVTFTAGSLDGATRTASLGITNDAFVEGTETASLGLSIVTDNTGGRASIAGSGLGLHAVTITDNDTATVGFVASTSTVGEAGVNDGLALQLSINFNGTGPVALARDVTVNVTGAGGTATGGGTDYTLPASVTFLAGDANGAQRTANLAITDDFRVEGSETAQLALGVATDGTGGQVTVAAGAASHTSTITDNDSATISFTSSSSTVGEGVGTKTLTAVLSLQVTGTGGTIGLDRDVTVGFTASGGDANGNDYSLPASVTFAAGSVAGSTKDASLSITNDAAVEGSESVTVGLSIVTDGTGGRASITTGTGFSHTVFIDDNDFATLGFDTPSSSVTEGAASDPLDVKLSIYADGNGTPTLARDVTFSLLVSPTPGTASLNSDYTLPLPVTFGAGALSGDTLTANLAITDDQAAEPVETANLLLNIVTDGTGHQVSLATDGTVAHTTSITDNDIDLAVSSTSSLLNIAGAAPNNVTFTFKVQNDGFIDATNVTLDEAFTLPGGVTYSTFSSINGGVFTTNAAGGTWTIPTVAAQGFVTLTVVFTSDHTTAHNATATVVGVVGTADQVIVNGGNDSDLETATIIRQADLSVSITDMPDPVGPTQTLTYVITVLNHGPSDNTSATVTDMLPASLTNVTWTAAFSTGSTGNASGNGAINETVSVPLNGTVTYTVTGKVPLSAANSNIDGSASVSSTEDTNSANDSASTSTFVGGVDLQLTQDDSDTSVVPGELIKYVLTYKNGGFVTATGVKITDVVPANTHFDAANSSSGWTGVADGSAAGTTATYDVGSVAVADAPVSVTFAVRVNATVSAGAVTIVNNPSITDDGGSGTDIAPSDNTASDTNTLVAAPDLLLTSTADASLIIRGQTLHTVFHYSNVGNQDAVDATITATVPLGTAFNALDSNPAWSQVDATHYAFDIASLPAGAAASPVIFAVDVNTTRVPGLHQVDTTATIDDGGINGPDPTPLNNTATNSAAPTRIYEGIYAVSQGIAVAGRFGTPTIHVYDPIDGHQLYEFDAYESKYRASIRVAVADINGDGFDDIITTSGIGTGRLRVFNGLTGQWLHDDPTYTGGFKNEIAAFTGKVFERGAFVAAGDLDGDGRADIVVGSALGGGKVRIFDGLTAQPRTFGGSDTFFQPFGKTFRGGVRVAVGDILGDTKADLVTGMGYYGSQVKVYDANALNGSVRFALAPLAVPAPPVPPPVAAIDFKIGAKNYRGGVSVGAGDLDGDGKLDLIIGRNLGRPTVVEAFSGLLKDAGGNPLAIGSAINPFDKDPMRPLYALGVRVAAIDINFDGIADIIAGSGGNNKAVVNIYSGADHTLLRTFNALPKTPNSSLFVAGTAVSPVYRPSMAP